MSSSLSPQATKAMELARQGDVPAAIYAGELAIRDTPNKAGLRLFVGLLHARQGDLDGAATHLRHAVMLAPQDLLPRLELARALIGLDLPDEAEQVIDDIGVLGPPIELMRLRALIHRRRGEHGEAAALYRQVVQSDTRDFESWDQMGGALLGLGDLAGAIEAFGHALALRPDLLPIRIRLADVLVAAGRGENALETARAHGEASDPAAAVAIARLEDRLGRPEEAAATLETALAAHLDFAPALFALADLAERANRIDRLGTLLDRMEVAGVPAPDTALLRARYLKRRGDLPAALAVARSAPESIDAGTRAQIIGQISDRLGEHDTAFTAFAEMNRLTAIETADTRAMAEDYRAMIGDRARITTADWYRHWPIPREPAGRPAPAFLFGFPRSGTTLLDTMLMGHPDTLVLEERPVLHAVSERSGGISRLADLDQAEIDALRALYFAELDAIAPDTMGRLVIDKLPLGIVDTALVHRIFPDARFIFVERHPCDVVLSCLMTRFQPQGGMASFLDLTDTARLYDTVLAYWEQCRTVFPLAVHAVHYERMIEDAEAELRPLARFLGLDWHPRLIDHGDTARTRAFIATPSYAQVTEPLYTRARGRWEHYRGQMAPVLPILLPWAERMGYRI